MLTDAIGRRELLGTKEFYVSWNQMTRLLKTVLREVSRPVLSLNRPQAGGRALVHRVEWEGIIFISVSRWPFVVA